MANVLCDKRDTRDGQAVLTSVSRAALDGRLIVSGTRLPCPAHIPPSGWEILFVPRYIFRTVSGYYLLSRTAASPVRQRDERVHTFQVRSCLFVTNSSTTARPKAASTTNRRRRQPLFLEGQRWGSCWCRGVSKDSRPDLTPLSPGASEPKPCFEKKRLVCDHRPLDLPTEDTQAFLALRLPEGELVD